MKLNKSLALLSLAFICVSSMVGCTRLKVRRFNPPPPSLSNTRASTILSNMTTVLRINDGPGDVACKVRFRRKGGVAPFTTGDGSIDSSAEFNAVIALPGEVKTVRFINWCSTLIPNVIGCAPRPGQSFTVVRITPNLEGILWAHEYGHNKGLRHRNDPNAVMNPTIGPTRRRVNSTECAAFRQ